jgi:alkaline phosphatase
VTFSHYVVLVEKKSFSEIHATVALHETMAFDKAVETALAMTDTAETLIIVTADHAHTMTMAGYPDRGTDIRGIQRSMS